MTPAFDSFVLLAEMRTGSNFLEANLNAMPGVACHGEAFNPHFIGKLNQMELFGIDLAARDADPLALLRAMRDQTQGISGFRYFHDHDPRILPEVLSDPACAKIVLTRNPVESYVSWKIAKATGQWKLTNAKKLKTAQADFDAAEFETHLEQLQGFQVALLHALQTSGQTAFYIDYEDIGDTDVLNGLAKFLGVKGALSGPDATLKKQNPEEIEEKVANFPQMEAALARLDRFNLSRTPNFEPRRAASVPSFHAAGPLLYMPLKGGPEAQVVAWMAGLGPETQADFTQKTLRQWMRAHAPHRSFTVLRHPLARAFTGFTDMILPGRLPHIREALVKTYKLPLPKPGKSLPDGDLHALFLEFLRFLKLNVAGQTGLRVDAHFASQTAVLQGFAQFQGPDLVLREEDLAEDLPRLAARLGLPAPGWQPTPDAVLAALCDQALQDAARDAYTRDFIGFGFTDWRG